MMYKYLLTTVGYLLLTLQARGGSEAIAVGDLPPVVGDHIKSFYADAKVVNVRKETEDGKECYSVTIVHAGRTIELYASPDGATITWKQGPITLNSIVDSIITHSIVVLLPGMIAGLFLMWLVQTKRERQLIVYSRWALAWLGASITICVILLSLSTVPRNKDPLVTGFDCILWGAISASFAEVIWITTRSVLGYRPYCRRYAIGLCIVILVLLSLTIPVEIMRTERENQYFKALTLTHPIR
jgi:hypothetical protein